MTLKTLLLNLLLLTSPTKEILDVQDIQPKKILTVDQVLNSLSTEQFHYEIENYQDISTITVSKYSDTFFYEDNKVTYFFLKIPDKAKIILLFSKDLELFLGKKFETQSLGRKNIYFKNMTLESCFLSTEEYTFLIESNTAFSSLLPVPLVVIEEDGYSFVFLPGVIVK